MATLQDRLAEAELAYHNLMTGQLARVIIDQNNEQVQYTTATAATLYAYIQSLKSQIAQCAAGVSDTKPSQPLQFIF